jgi:23S rRNA pseudouridine2605 synthase
MKEKIQKVLSEYGIASRRAAEKMIADGRVKVNGETAVVGMRANPAIDILTIDDVPLEKKSDKIYIMLNKPKGYVTTVHDEKNRRTVMELVKEIGIRVYPVGRLDINSEGLLLMTNDGDFAYRMTHPSMEKDKEYLVELCGETDKIKDLSQTMDIDGYTIKPAKVKLLAQKKNSFLISITIHEGRNRQIRKMCAKCDLRVLRLKRIAIGELRLGKLRAGCWRPLTQTELDTLNCTK